VSQKEGSEQKGNRGDHNNSEPSGDRVPHDLGPEPAPRLRGRVRLKINRSRACYWRGGFHERLVNCWYAAKKAGRIRDSTLEDRETKVHMNNPDHQAQPASDGICAVMVTYNPDPSLEVNVQALLPQVSKLIIVDNQSSRAHRPVVARVASLAGIEVIWNDQNLGIAAGLNTGIERAAAAGAYSWIGTFDQDSFVSADFVQALLDAYQACPFRETVGMVGASYLLAMRESPDFPLARHKQVKFREVKTLMTSGSLIKNSALAECGRFDESLYMDYVDHEFGLRLRRHNFRLIQAASAVLNHRLGSPTTHRFLGKRFMVTNYAPRRRYLNTRNRLVVYRRYISSETSWVLRDILKWIPEIAKVFLVEQDRFRKSISFARGCWDGMRVPR
jgi:rhamnosyltransferase